MKQALMTLTLVVVAAAVVRGEVTIKSEPLTLPYWTAEANWKTDPKSAKPLASVRGTQQPQGERTLATQVLENEYLRVQVVPELGGVVARAVYKPTGDDLFFYEGKLKNWLAYWESGVKMSFPYYEHGLGTEQPASWRVIKNPDGSVTLAMWMEFSRFNEAWQRRRYGRFSNMTFSEHVTLRPGENRFSITFRIVNPGPWKQGRRLWTDTLLPRNQTKDGVVQGAATPPAESSTEWVFPTMYASDHGGIGFGKYDQTLSKIAGRKGGSFSVFAWDIPFGFAGLYYPEVAINRLRLFNPKIAPGAKQWFIGEASWNPEKPNYMYNFCELWGGSDDVFEDIESWIGPGESYQFTYDYTLIKGLGKVDWADATVALQVGAGAVNVVTLRPVAKLSATLDGKPLGEAVACAPDKVAKFALPAGTTAGKLVLTADGAVVFDRSIPVTIPDDTTKHDKIRAAFTGMHHFEMRGNADEHMNTYQAAIKQYPEGSTDKGRVLLRDGQLDAAIACLTTAAETDAGEGAYLLGVALLEKGDKAGAKSALEKAAPKYTPARYYLAVLALAENRTDAARAQLAELTKALPSHWEARLLLAKVAGDKELLQSLAQEDPADPRVAWVRGDAEALKALLAEPGAQARLDEFVGLTKGQYPVPARIRKEAVANKK